MTALILYFLLALVVSFVCSLVESVILSISRAHIGMMVKMGSRSGNMLKNMKANIDRPLSAILTVNTIAHTVGAAAVGAESVKVFGNQWVAITSAVLTFAILVFSEIIPKTLGAVHWRKLAGLSAYIIALMIIITYPFVIMLKGISYLITRDRRSSRLTRDDLLTLAQIGETEGILLKKEARIIENLFRLNRIYAADVLTPRSVILAFQKDQTVEEVVNKYNPIRFSQIPVYDRDIDNVTGMVFRSKILEMYFKGEKEATMESITKPVYVVPQTKSVAKIMDEFIKRQEQIFLVVDEYGGTEGIITLEDAIETLLGVEIVDELDTEEDMRKLARKRWKARLKRNKLDPHVESIQEENKDSGDSDDRTDDRS